MSFLDETPHIPTDARANNKSVIGVGGSAPRAPAPRPQNPKDIHGYKKVDLSLVPDIAVFHEAAAFIDGAEKYGPYNWRDHAVLARVYIAACKRHLDYWMAGQENASDSGVHHLGHARACLAILLDAQATGNLIDNRPKSPLLIELMDALNAEVKKRSDERANRAAAKPQS